MSGLTARGEDPVNGVDVREQGNSLRVATNTPHLVSLGTGRLSTAVTLHPIKQGRVTIGSDPTCDIYVAGTGVCNVHCRVENSHDVVTLYPVNGCTLLDGIPVDKPTRLSQGSMLTIGRSNYLRFNHPEEAKLIKSVLPTAHISMAPIQFQPNEECSIPGYTRNLDANNQCYQNAAVHQKIYKESPLSPLEHELEMTIKELSRKKPPVAPRRPYRDVDLSDSNSDQESQKPRLSSIMAKVSKFEYYAKSQSQPKSLGRSQFYTSHTEHTHEISPKVFSSNSLTVNTPAKDVLGGKNIPTNYINKINKENQLNIVTINENNVMTPRNCSYANVAIRKTKIDDIVRNLDDNNRCDVKPTQKKVNNDQQNNIYGKINNDFNNKNRNIEQNNFQNDVVHENNVHNASLNYENKNNKVLFGGGDVTRASGRSKPQLPSPNFDRNPQYSPVYANSSHFDRSVEAESRRFQAYQERVREEEQQEAESARLDKILNMCAEYQRQVSAGTPTTPTEKRSQNKIITNGSLPRSVVLNNPNFVQTSEGYYKFDTSHNRTSGLSQSLPTERNLSTYENLDMTQVTCHSHTETPEVIIRHNNVGRMDELGIPLADDNRSPTHFPLTDLSSPIMIRKLGNQNEDVPKILLNMPATSPIGSPYENLYQNRNLKPKSPNTQSPRSRIKTTFAHKNLPSPQYFIFPTPPPHDNCKRPDFESAMPQVPKKPNVEVIPNDIVKTNNTETTTTQRIPPKVPEKPIHLKKGFENINKVKPVEVVHNRKETEHSEPKFEGIEKQLSLEEEIPMIDDSDLTDDIEFRYSRVIHEPKDKEEIEEEKEECKEINQQKVECIKETNEQKEENKEITPPAAPLEVNVEVQVPESCIVKNKSFEDVKKELMADIPELEEFEKELKESNRQKIIQNLSDSVRNMEAVGGDTTVDQSLTDVNVKELKLKYDNLKEERKRLLSDIHEIKRKMSEIRSQEDDILRELEMEKALIKGEYDSEIAILNIEQMKRAELLESARRKEDEIRKLKEKQESRQNEMRDRVDIATLKVERIKSDLKDNIATLEELQNAQDILENETKIFEDLEFQHLEEESEMLSNREDIQNEIILLSKKIEAQKTRILTLKSEANENLTSALDETKILQAEYVRLVNRVEDLTGEVQTVESKLKPLIAKLNDIERTQSPDSAFYTDQTRAKSGEFGYSPQSSDSDDLDLSKIPNFENHRKEINDKFNSIDQMSQSMIVDIERRDITDLIDDESPSDSQKDRYSESPSKSSTSSKEKKGFWERNFDSLSRLKNKDKKAKTPPAPIDIMSQSLNENLINNNDNIETDSAVDRFNSLRLSKTKKDKKDSNGPTKSNSSSKIPTFAALGKIIKKDSFSRRNKDTTKTEDTDDAKNKSRYVKNTKSFTENKYNKSKSLSPDKPPPSQADNIELPNQKGHNVTFDNVKSNKDSFAKIMHRKSCGDEPGLKPKLSEFQKISDSGKIPSQDDIDRISKVTIDAPLLSSDTDMNSLGRRTLDSLMEIERKRLEMLEEQGCQVIENEREKISELKKRVADETKKLWNEKQKSVPVAAHPDTTDDHYERYLNESTGGALNDSLTSERTNSIYERMVLNDDDTYNSTLFDDSSGLVSSSVEELQVRNSRADSLSSRPIEDEKLSDDSRPLSHASDLSRDNILSSSVSSGRRRARGTWSESSRPLTRYLPVDRDDFDLRRHIETAGHQVEVCPHLSLSASSCRGYLHKLGAKFHTWSKRWFVFDRDTKTFVYYWDKSEKKPRGGAYFQVIEEVYLDHGNTSKSPNPQSTFVVKTRQRRYYLMAPSGEAARIWIDVIFTGAQGYIEYME